MAYFYLDDSKRHTYGFSLAAFVICKKDPTSEVRRIFNTHGFDPDVFEFKSSILGMKEKDSLRRLRDALTDYIGRNCQISVCVVNGDKRLGPAALMLLSASLKHPRLADRQHRIFFDQGLFSSKKRAMLIARSDASLSNCDFAFEQDSRSLLGIQLADLVAYTCSTMLRETLSPNPKQVTLNCPDDSEHHNLEVPLVFELWAGIRHSFLSIVRPVHPDHSDHSDFGTADVHPWGLFVDESVNTKVASAAMERFGTNYLGCIH